MLKGKLASENCSLFANYLHLVYSIVPAQCRRKVSKRTNLTGHKSDALFSYQKPSANQLDNVSNVLEPVIASMEMENKCNTVKKGEWAVLT